MAASEASAHSSALRRFGSRLFCLGSGQVAFCPRLLDFALGLVSRRLGFRHALLGLGDGLLCLGYVLVADDDDAGDVGERGVDARTGIRDATLGLGRGRLGRSGLGLEFRLGVVQVVVEHERPGAESERGDDRHARKDHPYHRALLLSAFALRRYVRRLDRSLFGRCGVGGHFPPGLVV